MYLYIHTTCLIAFLCCFGCPARGTKAAKASQASPTLAPWDLKCQQRCQRLESQNRTNTDTKSLDRLRHTTTSNVELHQIPHIIAHSLAREKFIHCTPWKLSVFFFLTASTARSVGARGWTPVRAIEAYLGSLVPYSAGSVPHVVELYISTIICDYMHMI